MKFEIIFLLLTFVVLSHQLPLEKNNRLKRQLFVYEPTDVSIEDDSISDSNESEYAGTNIGGTQLYAVLKRRSVSDVVASTRTKRHSIDPVDVEIRAEERNPLYYGIRLRKNIDNDINDNEELLQVAETHVFRPIFRYKSQVSEKRRIRTPPKP